MYINVRETRTGNQVCTVQRSEIQVALSTKHIAERNKTTTTAQKTVGEPRCLRRVSSSCFLYDSTVLIIVKSGKRVNVNVNIPMDSDEDYPRQWEKRKREYRYSFWVGMLKLNWSIFMYSRSILRLSYLNDNYGVAVKVQAMSLSYVNALHRQLDKGIKNLLIIWKP